MRGRVVRLVVTFLLLLILLALEVWMSLPPLSSSIRPVILIPALAMVALVSFGFMEIATAPPAAHLFAVAGYFGSPSCSASVLWILSRAPIIPFRAGEPGRISC